MRLASIVPVLLLAGCPQHSPTADGGDADAGTPPPDAGEPVAFNLLFIGNSYTYVNDLPGMLQTLAAGAGVELRHEEVVEGGATLSVHWANGIARARIADGGFTHVVVQGQSVEPLYVVDAFVYEASRFAAVATDAGAVPVWYVTWARATNALGDVNGISREEMQDRLSYTYGQAATASPGSVLACVGEAFRHAFDLRPQLQLYDPDGSHPSVAGTYLAASTFFVALTGHSVPEPAWAPAGLDAADALFLRRQADIGSACADVHVRAQVSIIEYTGPLGLDGGPPFPFMPSAIPVSHDFLAVNSGRETAGLTDGLSLSPPFTWTNGSYPGGAGTARVLDRDRPFCGAALDAGADCLLSVTFSGAADADGVLSLGVTGAYDPTASRALRGVRALAPQLRIEAPGDDARCGAASSACAASVAVVRGAPRNLLVVNAGATPAPGPIGATALSAPFFYGPADDGGSFPGSTGPLTVGGAVYDACADGGLTTGQRCAFTVGFEGSATYYTTITVSFPTDSDGGVPHVPVAPWNPSVRSLVGLPDADAGP